MGKKKEEHHGGAWKVAYADFVTAMMALFIVLWIIKDKPKLAALITAQFNVPLLEAMFGGSTEKEGDNNIDEIRLTQDEMDKTIEKIAAELQKLMDKEDPDQNTMEVSVTSEGLKILLFDNPKKPLFQPKTAILTKWGEFIMESLSWIIDKNKLNVFIDGHVATSDASFPKKNYGLWELSVDRSNACRKSLINYACPTKLIYRVTGYGDSKPLPDTEPESEENDRMMFTLNIPLYK
jgi:chemotaxis protein MotB